MHYADSPPLLEISGTLKINAEAQQVAALCPLQSCQIRVLRNNSIELFDAPQLITKAVDYGIDIGPDDCLLQSLSQRLGRRRLEFK